VKARQARRLLHVLGLATEEGDVRAPLRRKFNQINRLVLLVQPLLAHLPSDREVVVLDCGCGKSYLSFVLNYHFRRNLKRKAFFYGIDRGPELIAQCEARRAALKYNNMRFEVGDIAGLEPERPVDLLVSLHACNTATDAALERAVRLGAPFSLVAPCCQQELAAQLRPESCPGLFDEGLLKEKMAALMTDALRCLALRACGYAVRVAEFVPPWDTPKNVLIRAERAGPPDPRAAAEFREICERFGVAPAIGAIVPGAE
jgi:SAM-dependent methyltransferase